MKMMTQLGTLTWILTRVHRPFRLLRAYRAKASHEELQVELRDGTRVWIREGSVDVHTLLEIFRHGHYMLTYTPKQGDLVVDVGANIGTFTILAARQGARVVSFEPVKANLDLLERNVSENHVQDLVRVVPAAVGEKKGTTSFYLADEHGSHSRDKHSRGMAQSRVPLVRLEDELPARESVALLKMDCEGGEYEILKTASPGFWKRVERIALEYHDRDEKERNHAWIVEFLKSKGYQVTVHEDLYLIYATR